MDSAELATPPLIEHLLELHAARASGELVVERARSRKVFGLLCGHLVTVESTLPSESLCERVRDAGLIDGLAATRAREHAATKRVSEAAALTSLQLLEARQLVEQVRLRISACARDALLWQDATIAFDDTTPPADATRAFRCEALPLIHATLASSWAPERIASALFARAAHYAAAREDLVQHAQRWLGDDAAALRLVSLLDGNRTLETVLGAAFGEPALLAGLWLADRTGSIRYAEGPAVRGEHVPPEIEIEVSTTDATGRDAPGHETERSTPESTAPAEHSTPRAKSPAFRPSDGEASEVHKEIVALHDLLGTANHYEILGLESNVSAAQVKKAYFTAAKRYHPDKLARLGLEQARDIASEVFAAFAEAHEALGDPERRKAYDQALASGGLTEDIDVTRLAQAEGFFRKGEILMKMGDFRGAAELLETAVELWPDECVYHATLGWAHFRKSPPDNDAASEALETAIGIDGNNAQAHLWLSQVLRSAGDVNASAEHAALARRLDPDIG